MDTNSILGAQGLFAGYGGHAVVQDMSLYVNGGEIVALLGANGAGKTTTLLTLAGELPPVGGTVTWKDEPVRLPLHKMARLGVRLITEERCVFMSLTVADNLRLAHKDIEPCLEIFPELKRLLKRKAGLLSGGEQQMLALGRALGGKGLVLLVDELSLGLAPKTVERLFEAIRGVAASGVGVILVEQQFRRALEVAHRGYVLRRGRVVMSGSASDLLRRKDEVQAAYLVEVDVP